MLKDGEGTEERLEERSMKGGVEVSGNGGWEDD